MSAMVSFMRMASSGHGDSAWSAFLQQVGSGIGRNRAGSADSDSLSPSDWVRVEQLGRAHRVTPLLAAGIKATNATPPDDVAARIRDASDANKYVVLRQLGELRRIVGRLDAAGVPYILLKGPAVSAYARREHALRQMNDLDIAVSVDGIGSFEEILSDLGYVPTVVGIENLTTLTALREGGNEAPFRNPRRATTVEIHWDFFANKSLYPQSIDDEIAEAVVLDIEGIGVRTMSAERKFAYVCVHGAKHHWRRIKWLCDVAMLLEAETIQVAKAWEYACRLGVGDLVAEAIWMTENVLGLPVADTGIASFHAPPTRRRLATLEHGWLDVKATATMGSRSDAISTACSAISRSDPISHSNAPVSPRWRRRSTSRSPWIRWLCVW